MITMTKIIPIITIVTMVIRITMITMITMTTMTTTITTITMITTITTITKTTMTTTMIMMTMMIIMTIMTMMTTITTMTMITTMAMITMIIKIIHFHSVYILENLSSKGQHTVIVSHNRDWGRPGSSLEYWPATLSVRTGMGFQTNISCILCANFNLLQIGSLFGCYNNNTDCYDNNIGPGCLRTSASVVDACVNRSYAA